MGEDQDDGCRNRGEVDSEDHQGGAKIEHDHRRHQLARNFSDAPDAADHNNTDQRRDNDPVHPVRHHEAILQRGCHTQNAEYGRTPYK